MPPAPAALAQEEAEVQAARAARPDDFEGRVWRRMSTRTRTILLIAVIAIGIYTLFDYARQALTFLPGH
jgi:hypothetical protein